uniref:YEATS domain-containing protein n=2 Tax=Gossypium raimondii TaxID=29730 RepID=A0A0D2P350_GOSRA|nr:hypothetical protein B456_007G048500 [Gossypium raimondii]
MPQTAIEAQVEDGGSASKPQRIIKLSKTTDDSDKKGTNKRVKDIEICVPIVYGTIAFYLGRKASESQSHKWTVYVRGATNEDLGAVIKHVVFQLHPSFNNPTRIVEAPPFELSECGWGEFEIGISIFFHSDVCDKHLDLYHMLKLYPEDESGPQSTKKPVVMESYNEIVFPDPSECFFARVQNHPAVVVPRMPAGFSLPVLGKFIGFAFFLDICSSKIFFKIGSFVSAAPVENTNEKGRGDTKDHPLSQWFLNFSEADELLKLASARQQVGMA